MQYNGFRSIREYESECARLGYSTRRIPAHHKTGEPCFALITTPPGNPSGTSIECWTLFSADETRQFLDGVINGHNANYLGKLSAHGYFLDDFPAAVPPAIEHPAPPPVGLPDNGGQFCFF